LWNASRYVIMNTESQDCGTHGGDFELSLADQWIIEQFNDTVKQFRTALDNYRFDQAASIAYEFTWNQFCDWYLELTKPVLFNGTAEQLRGTRHTLITVLEQLLRLLHPLLPFITEAIWKRVAPLAGVSGDTIMMQPYPQVQEQKFATARDDMEWLKQVIVAVRNIRGEMNLSPSKPLPVLFKNADDVARKRLEHNANFLSALAKLESVTFLGSNDEAPASATALVGRMEIHIPMAGLIDTAVELARLDKAIEKAQKEFDLFTRKLSNENFVSKAPADVIEKERAKQAEAEETLQQLQQQRAKIAAH